MRKPAAILALLASAASVSAVASPVLSPAGEYALNASDCRPRRIFVTIADDSVTFPVFSCKGVSFDFASQDSAGATYKGLAKACIAEGQTQASPRTFRVVRSGSTAQFFWADGTRSGRLQHCAERKRR